MAIQTKAVATSTSASLLVPQTTRRRSVTIANEDATIIIRIGPSTVTNAGGAAGTRGFPIFPKTYVNLADYESDDSGAGEDIYVIADSGTPTVTVMESIP